MATPRKAGRSQRLGQRLGGLIRLGGTEEQIRETRLDLNASQIQDVIEKAAGDGGVRPDDAKRLYELMVGGA